MLRNLLVFANVISLLLLGRLVIRRENRKLGESSPFIFLVYPGTKADVDRYFPSFVQPLFKRFLPPVFPLGFLGRGLVMGTITYEEEYTQDRCREIQEALYSWANDIGARTIALAGRMPGIFLSKGLTLDPPFVKGDQGTVHAVVSSIRSVRKHHGLSRKDTTVAIIGGGGFIGAELCTTLRGIGHQRVIALDIRFKEETDEDGILRTSNYSQLVEADIVVVLTRRGEDIEPAVPFLINKLIVDDTHPQLPHWLVESLEAQDNTLYKVVVTLEGFSFDPAIPGYKPTWIPGCVWQAVATAVASDMGRGTGFKNLEEFHAIAKELPYNAPLARHYDNKRARRRR